MLSAAALMVSAACNRSPASPSPSTGVVTPGVPTVVSVRVSGPTRVAPGQRVSFTASASYSDGTTKDVTATASWAPGSGCPTCPLYFLSPGEALGSSPGELDIYAHVGDKSGSQHVLVLEEGTFKLTGVVAETGGRLVPGVSVDVTAGKGAGLHATTRSEGQYAFYGVAGPITVRASGPGFESGSRDVVVTSDMQAEPLTLRPLETPADVSGTWTMTLSPSPHCSINALPDIARSRTYQIVFHQQGTGFKLDISSPTLKVLNPGEDSGTVLGSQVQFVFFGDTDYGDWSSSDLIDQLTPTETLQFDGIVRGTVAGSELRASLDGDLVYFVSPNFGPNWWCRAKDHVVTLRR
jgi:hypothetical protein